MRWRGAQTFAAIVWLAIASPLMAADRTVALPDGRKLNFFCLGKGSPTILLESGWSADSRAWPKVLGPLAATTRTCAYDRAGSGRSDAGPLPRDGAAIARDLDAGLRAARISGPFILIGHSAGGLYARHFANLRARDVVGLLLVDSSVEHQQRRLQTAFGPGAGSLDGLIARARACVSAASAGKISAEDPATSACATEPPAAAQTRWEARLSELQTLDTSTSSQLDAGRASYGDMPVSTLSATRGRPGPVADMWLALHGEIAARSACGHSRLVAESGHLMMKDRPDAIIEAAQTLLAAARANSCPFADLAAPPPAS